MSGTEAKPTNEPVEEVEELLRKVSIKDDHAVEFDENDPLKQKLAELDTKHKSAEADYDKEWRVLKQKYSKIFAPFYVQRREVLLTPNESGNRNTGTPAIPGFWCQAFKNCGAIRDIIKDGDEEILEYLSDVRSEFLDETEQTSFKLTFEFAKNPFFDHSVLEKTFILREEEDGEKVLSRTDGTKIVWAEGKDVTKKTITRKQKNKRTKQVRIITETVENDSFFGFFGSQVIPTDEQFDTMSESEIEDLERVVETAFDAAVAIRDKIIPRALGWYRGLEHDDDEEESDEDYSGDDDDADDDDDDEEDDESVPTAQAPSGKEKDNECQTQ